VEIGLEQKFALIRVRNDQCGLHLQPDQNVFEIGDQASLNVLVEARWETFPNPLLPIGGSGKVNVSAGLLGQIDEVEQSWSPYRI